MGLVRFRCLKLRKVVCRASCLVVHSGECCKHSRPPLGSNDSAFLASGLSGPLRLPPSMVKLSSYSVGLVILGKPLLS